MTLPAERYSHAKYFATCQRYRQPSARVSQNALYTQLRPNGLTPYCGGKMPEHSWTAQPTFWVPFQTTCVKCDGCGL